MLKSAKKLILYVKSVGRVPGSFVSHQTYTWVDPQGRSVSPPPDVDLMGRRMSESLGRKSGLNLLKDGDEKKVSPSQRENLLLSFVYEAIKKSPVFGFRMRHLKPAFFFGGGYKTMYNCSQNCWIDWKTLSQWYECLPDLCNLFISLDNKGSCWMLKDFYCSVTMLRVRVNSHHTLCMRNLVWFQ